MVEIRIEVKCPGCEKPFLVPSTEQGNVADCPYCQGWVDVPDVGRPPTTAELLEAASLRNAHDYELQSRETNRQLEIAGRQLEQSQRFIDRRDRQDARFDRVLDHLEAVVGRWEQLSKRIDRVVDRLDKE